MLALKKLEETEKTTDEFDVVIKELEKSLHVMESNYKKAISNLSILRNQVEHDGLTKLLRKEAFLRKLQNLMDESSVCGQEVHLMMIDLDHFKKVNDTYGHLIGDDVLARVSGLIKNYLNSSDLAGRFGGEEIIVAVQASFSETVKIAENIRQAVKAHRMNSQENVEFGVTLSIGITSAKKCGFIAKQMIADADAALYRAKNSGRDRVESQVQ